MYMPLYTPNSKLVKFVLLFVLVNRTLLVRIHWNTHYSLYSIFHFFSKLFSPDSESFYFPNLWSPEKKEGKEIGSQLNDILKSKSHFFWIFFYTNQFFMIPCEIFLKIHQNNTY